MKKTLPRKLDESCAVIGYLVREKLKNEAYRKWLQFEIPELQNSQERTIHKEIALASKYGVKGKFQKVEKIKNQLKKKYSSLRKTSKICPDLSWKTIHKIFNPKVLHEDRRLKTCDIENVHNIMKSTSCSIQLPSKKHTNVYFLICEGDEKEQQTSPYFQHILQKKTQMHQAPVTNPDESTWL